MVTGLEVALFVRARLATMSGLDVELKLTSFAIGLAFRKHTTAWDRG